MNGHALLRWRAAAITLLLGAAIGAVCLGLGGRLAMRGFALATARASAFTLRGTLNVMFAGAIAGSLGGVLFLVVGRFLPARIWLRGLVFAGVCYVLATPGFRPPRPLVFALFGPPFVAYGLALVATDGYLARGRRSSIPSGPESWATRLTRWRFNFFPAYRGTGARITYIRHDWSEVHIRLPLSWRTRNYVGTIFGGSMYGAVDPVYMVMLIKLLGPGYTVWDKAAAIRFRRPGRSTLQAVFAIDAGTVAAIRDELARVPAVERIFTVELTDAAGSVHATIDKTVYIGRREPSA